MLCLATRLSTSSTTITTWLHTKGYAPSSESTRQAIFVSHEEITTAWEAFTFMPQVLGHIILTTLTPIIINFQTKAARQAKET